MKWGKKLGKGAMDWSENVMIDKTKNYTQLR